MNNNKDALEYWNDETVESMYDKHLLNAETQLIKQHISENAKILDAGCGEGEGTLVYSRIPGVTIDAADFSDTRLKKAAQRLAGCENVTLKKVDFLGGYSLDIDYDLIISQRFLINITEWRLQQKVLLDLMSLLKMGGKLIMLEGSKQGVDSLNKFRSFWELDPIPVKWHNFFLDDDLLTEFMSKNGFKLIGKDGLGTYFLLTRGLRPIFDEDLKWDCDFNRIAAKTTVSNTLGIDDTNFSRLKLWIFKK